MRWVNAHKLQDRAYNLFNDQVITEIPLSAMRQSCIACSAGAAVY